MMMMMMMMIMMMTLLNSPTKFLHGIDKFYQLNWGLRNSKSWDEALYIYILYKFEYIYIYSYASLSVET